MKHMEKTSTHQEIAWQQVLLGDASVFSHQWTVLPAAIGGGISPKKLLDRYLAYIRGCTLSIIRPLLLKNGLEFRFFGTNWSLLSFSPPKIEADSLTLLISGGLLVHSSQCKSGEFRFTIETVPEGVCISIQLSKFCPMILGGPSPSSARYWLYRLTQGALHRLVTIRFLTQLSHELTGSPAAVRILNVPVCGGRPV
jgi:hypothetical protein